MSIPFFVASRNLQDLRNLPGCRVGTWANGLALRWGAVGPSAYPDRECLLRLVYSGAIPGRTGTWSLWLVLVVSADWRVATRLFRALRRTALAEPRLLGPWSPRRLEALAPALADRLVYPQRAVLDAQGKPTGATERVPGAPRALCLSLAGRESAVEVDYSPTDADCSADTEADEATLFPPTGGLP
jgi:hypothetical protein